MVQAFLGLGSNVGDRLGYLRLALMALSSRADIRLSAVSSVYETEPYGFVDQPWFLNLVAEVETQADPLSLLRACHAVEAELGRTRTTRWGPRTVDIDLLCYGDRLVELPELRVPHPQLHLRRFVLVPFAEIAPEFVVPLHDRSVAELLADCPDSSRVEYYASAAEIVLVESRGNPVP